jgi:hypothetical protein
MMAAVHFTALRLIEKSAGDKLQPGEVARFTNAAARMIDVYQNGCLVLQKLKTKGTQRVVVQYQQVNVNEGGQAVVAGKVGPLRSRGDDAKKGADEPHGRHSPGAALRGEHAAADGLPKSSDEEWPMPDARLSGN